MEYEMTIGKKVNQPFLITSKETLRLLRTGKARINLPNEIGFQLIINDDEEDD
jgi:hypothetical protein